MANEDWERCVDPASPLDKKWKLFEPWYRAARNTGYCKAVEIAVRDLYGIDEINAKTIRSLSERIAERNRPGVHDWILRERCNIDQAHVNALETPFFRDKSDDKMLRQDLSIVQLLNWPIPFDELARDTGVDIASFQAYARAIDELFNRYGRKANGIKQQSAYWRPQHFEDVSDADAERVFERAVRDADSVSEADRKKLQDWGFHRCVRNAMEYDLALKIHTGYKVAINYMELSDIRAAALNNVFIQYPKAKFSLFHISYPYQHEVVALCKHFRNVYADMCWSWIIDPEASRQFLRQFLTAVPANKLFAFGGDYIVAEPVYGHLRIARDGITRVLSELVADGYLVVPEAIEIARRILRDNALAVFPDPGKRRAGRDRSKGGVS
jgi:predicted TIM-barrel fold metal-dependent hydrolase